MSQGLVELVPCTVTGPTDGDPDARPVRIYLLKCANRHLLLTLPELIAWNVEAGYANSADDY